MRLPRLYGKVFVRFKCGCNYLRSDLFMQGGKRREDTNCLIHDKPFVSYYMECTLCHGMFSLTYNDFKKKYCPDCTKGKYENSVRRRLKKKRNSNLMLHRDRCDYCNDFKNCTMKHQNKYIKKGCMFFLPIFKNVDPLRLSKIIG